MKILVKVESTENKVIIRAKKLRAPSKRERRKAARYDLPSPVAKYVRISRSNPADKAIFDALEATNFSGWSDGEYECEVRQGRIACP